MSDSILPSGLTHLRLELAREAGRPQGDPRQGYDLLVPLDAEGRIDAAAWKSVSAFCRVRRFRPDEADRVGRLARGPGGRWFFDYGVGEADNEAGHHLGDECFIPGEYVSIREANGHFHPFRVVTAEAVRGHPASDPVSSSRKQQA